MGIKPGTIEGYGGVAALIQAEEHGDIQGSTETMIGRPIDWVPIWGDPGSAG